jgi:hypothetical protein
LASSGKVGLIYTGRAFTGECELDACAMNSN